eukprot:Gregarina_sp_Poly_1__602@NODE_1141_length_4960_cov_269_731453_g787_i0_p5_GENE_NODE_1141_length_4960_cov_269_731453_g787_i0NODE_1141_length_4960_cov_269_731453_g787_i0_p5_ORF_typecomplete_len159_score12_88_NODE_1141_length_4960_cov_269_731453_g787_i041414617
MAVSKLLYVTLLGLCSGQETFLKVQNELPVAAAAANEAFNCYFYGDWALDFTSWPEFPVIPMNPITLQPDGGFYRITSRIDNYFSTQLLPGGADCSNNILRSTTISTRIFGPHYEAERMWLNMLDHIKRISVSPTGRLNIWFGDDIQWNRVEFNRIVQ